jgi:hypothetical protein
MRTVLRISGVRRRACVDRPPSPPAAAPTAPWQPRPATHATARSGCTKKAPTFPVISCRQRPLAFPSAAATTVTITSFTETLRRRRPATVGTLRRAPDFPPIWNILRKASGTRCRWERQMILSATRTCWTILRLKNRFLANRRRPCRSPLRCPRVSYDLCSLF